MLRKALLASWATLLLIASAGTAQAGGPFVVDQVSNSGTALRWTDDKMVWCADQGDLSSTVDNATAISWIVDALNKWTNASLKNKSNVDVSTTSIKTQLDSTCGFGDITVDNYWDHVFDVDGKTVVIFDDTGEIIADLMGEDNVDYVVGLSQPLEWDDSGLHITEGFAIFNGRLLSNGVLSADSDRAERLFKGTILHELGHLLNMDHGQVNFDLAANCDRDRECTPDSSDIWSCECTGAQYIPTMYPNLVTARQGYDLHRDDIVAVSWIYPTDDFENDFCTITGEIYDADGNPLKGVNVIAKSAQSTTAGKVDARAYVSGVLKTRCLGDSRYYLRGIKPNVPYTIEYEAIGSEFTGASDFEPLGDDSPFGSYSGTIESPSGDTTVYCTDGGQTIDMASVTIDTYNYCASSDNLDTTSDSSSGSTKSCSLYAFGTASLPYGLAILALLLFVPRLRRSFQRIYS